MVVTDNTLQEFKQLIILAVLMGKSRTSLEKLFRTPRRPDIRPACASDLVLFLSTDNRDRCLRVEL